MFGFSSQIRVQCEAFREGLSDVINIEWLRMFNSNELQVLISGAPVPIAIDDLRPFTVYSGAATDVNNSLTWTEKLLWQCCIVLVHVCLRRLHGRPPGDRGVLAGDQRLHRAAATPAVEVRHQLFATAASWLYGKRRRLSLTWHDRL